MNYCKETYGVPNDHGRIVEWNGRRGIICRSTHHQHYIHVNFDDDKPMHISYLHPTEPGLKYLEEFGEHRKLTRSQKRYQEYLNSHHYEAGNSFAFFLGIKGVHV